MIFNGKFHSKIYKLKFLSKSLVVTSPYLSAYSRSQYIAKELKNG
uniref:Uncharacterized protein n=1 Tax=uncultured Thiotrichaceae bacterium TaxID=298394 RepID=A0A6S6U309_9GAMM|nr:MAG: Unknown protein [uncultured Thiotrichaceae bacterium]